MGSGYRSLFYDEQPNFFLLHTAGVVPLLRPEVFELNGKNGELGMTFLSTVYIFNLFLKIQKYNECKGENFSMLCFIYLTV